MTCQHCGRLQASRPRQLCYKCFPDRNIRNRYPSGNPGANGGNKWAGEPTEAEVEALIAAQLPTMPPRRVGED